MQTKLFKTLAATAMSVLAIACAKEPVADNGQQAGVSFEIENPVVISKAGEGTTATQLYYQVFTADGQLIEGLPAQSKPLSSLKTTVTFQLVKDQTYKFIFWAQTPTAGYYSFAGTDDVKDIRTITANYEGKEANDENFDAFFATESFKVTGPVTKTVTLKRPFAQINIGTKDQLKAGEATAPAIDFTGAKSSVTVKGVPTVFSPLATTPETMLTVPETVTFASAAIPTGLLKVNETDYNYLAMNYVFAPAEGTVCDLTAEIVLTGREPIQLSSPTTPIKRNWRTNILGSLLTSSADFDVVVDPSFGDDNDVDLVNIKNEASLKALLATGGTAKLADNIEISKGLVVPSGKNVVLNLGGKTIKATAAGVVAITVYGDLEITGAGTVDGGEGGDNQAIQVQPGAKLVIRDGSFTVGGDANGLGNSCIENRGGEAEIYGGTFRADAPYNGWYYVLNQLNGVPGTFKVYGGKFENYDPATGDDNLGGNFVADGYKSTKVGDYYVVTKEDVTPVANQEGLDVAMENLTSKPATISLPAGNFTTYGKSATQGKTLTFNGTGAENTNFIVGKNLGVSGEGNSDYSLENADVTFNDLTISTGDGLSYNYRGFVRAKSLTFVNCTIKERLSYWGGIVKFINCKFEPNTYKDNNGNILPDYNITTYQGTEFSFENCSFKSAGKFMNLYKEQNVPYAVRVKDCTFIATEIDKPVLNMKSYTGVEYKIYFEGTNIAKTEDGVEFPLYGGETASNAEVYVNNALVWSKGQAF